MSIVGMPRTQERTVDSYNVALICPMGVELAAVEGIRVYEGASGDNPSIRN